MSDPDPIEIEVRGGAFGVRCGRLNIAFTFSGDAFLFGFVLFPMGFQLCLGPFGLAIARTA